MIIKHFPEYGYFQLLLAIPLTYLVFYAFKAKQVDVDLAIIIFTAYCIFYIKYPGVAFAVLFKDHGHVNCSGSERCMKAYEVFNIFGQIVSWVCLLILALLIIPCVIASPLDIFLKSHDESSKSVESSKKSATTNENSKTEVVA